MLGGMKIDLRLGETIAAVLTYGRADAQQYAFLRHVAAGHAAGISAESRRLDQGVLRWLTQPTSSQGENEQALLLVRSDSSSDAGPTAAV